MYKQKIKWNLILHDIRSVQNVASLFRLSDCLSINKLFLSGITPSPLDRFSRIRPDFAKISLNSEKNINWQRIGPELNTNQNIEDFLNQSILELQNFLEEIKKQKNTCIICVEQNQNSLDYKKVAEKIQNNFLENKSIEYCIIFGRERYGIDKDILKFADFIAEIPQYGKKESLNIFSSASIVLYRFLDF